MDKLTMFVGICQINDRQHLCGLWPSIDAAKKELTGYEVTRVPAEVIQQKPDCMVSSFDSAAKTVWVAEERQFANDDDRDSHNFNYSEADGFTIYEFAIDSLPGFVPFDED